MLHALSFKVKFFVYQNVHIYSVKMFLYITALFAVFYHLKVYACVACNWGRAFHLVLLAALCHLNSTVSLYSNSLISLESQINLKFHMNTFCLLYHMLV
jgi:hypothetical protein